MPNTKCPIPKTEYKMPHKQIPITNDKNQIRNTNTNKNEYQIPKPNTPKQLPNTNQAQPNLSQSNPSQAKPSQSNSSQPSSIQVHLTKSNPADQTQSNVFLGEASNPKPAQVNPN